MKKTIKRLLISVIISGMLVSSGCSVLPSGTTIQTEPTADTGKTTGSEPTVAPTVIPTETTTVGNTTVPYRTANLRSGYWCYYGGGESMTAYTFSDEVLTNGKYAGHMSVYDVKNNTVSLMDAQDNNGMINYEITDDAVLLEEEGGYVKTMYFAEDDDTLFVYSDGKELPYYHFSSVPDYDALQAIAPAIPVPDTMEEFLTMDVPSILKLLDYDITVECNGKNSRYGGSDGSICFYNFSKLPGFVFSPYGVTYSTPNTDLDGIKRDILANRYTKLSFVVAKDGAKMNDAISSDMTYNEISAVTGRYKTQPPAGQGNITQSLSDFCANSTWVTVYYYTSREARLNHMDKSGYDPEYLKQENPKVDYIIAYNR